MRAFTLCLLLSAALEWSASAAPLSGIYRVGPTGAYHSLSAAIASVQGQGMSAPVVLELQATYVSTVENFPLTLGTLPTTAANTLTIRPEDGATNISISSADTTAATVDLNGAQFVTIDGRPSGAGTAKELSISNTNTAGVALRFINEASNNTLKFLTLQSGNNSDLSGIVLFDATTGANGNDNNTIDTCDIHDGTTNPANCIYSRGSSGTTAQANSGNVVTNCNIFNFTSAAGLLLASGNDAWTITGNSFYRTTGFPAISLATTPIMINAPNGSGFIVTNNFIGGSAPNCGGMAFISIGNTAANPFQGIQLNVGTTTPTSVQGNTIANIIWPGSSNADTPPGVWTGIYVQAGNVNIGTVTGNTIGSGSGTGSISITASGTSGTTYGISSVSNGVVAIANNTIGSITMNGESTGVAASLVGIQVTAGANTISNNSVGSATTPNSLNAATASTSSNGQRVTGILSSSSTGASIVGNTVANLNNNYVGTGNGQVAGIVTSAGVNTIATNTVRNLSTRSQSTAGAAAASVLGVSQASTSAGQTVAQNVVHSLANTSATASATVIGIRYQGNTTTGPNTVARNLVHSLVITSSSTASQLYGMYFDSGTFTAQNNMIRIGLDADGVSTAGLSRVIGLYDAGSTAGRNFYHNSVFVGGVSSSGLFYPSTAFFSVGSSNARDFHNNIFANARSYPGGSFKHYAVQYTVQPSGGLVADNNLFFVSGAGAMLGDCPYGSNQGTLAMWRTMTKQDLSSAVGDPLFANPTGTAATLDLHLQPSNPAEGAGAFIAAVTDDFDGQTRSSLTPVDIGADAGDFTSTGDIFAPAISYPLLSKGCTDNRMLTGWASVTDVYGAVAGGANAPRFYYKKSTDADAFAGNTAADNGWKYVAGATSGGGNYSFTIDYSIINGGSVSVGDTIQYFVVAQDVAGNLASGPVGATASSGVNPVQNINGKPFAGVNSYSIVATISGTVTVGSGGTFPSLSGAGGLFSALNGRVLVGDLTVNVTSDTTEDGSTVLNPALSNHYPADPGAFPVVIRPDSAAMRTISGSVSGITGMIRLSGANRVTVDGSFGGGGRYLTLRNTNTSGSTLVFIYDASSNTVRNCVIEGAGSNGVVAFRSGVTTGNDNNVLTGNQIRDRSDAVGVPSSLVYCGGSPGSAANSANTVSNNELFNFTSRGVLMDTGADSWTISGNAIYQTSGRTTQVMGIQFSGAGTNLIRENTVSDLTTSSSAFGIYLLNQTGSTIVSGNRCLSLGSPAAGMWFVGFFLSPTAGNGVVVVNNMVAINPSGTSTKAQYGISDFGAVGSTTLIAHNTVLLTGVGGAGTDTWAFRTRGNSTATVKDNLFLNLRTGGSNHFAANRLPGSTGALTMDFNVYAGSGLAVASDFFDASDGTSGIGTPISYAQWQTNVPSDTHSSASNPGGNYSSTMFVDPANGDLHLVPGGSPLVNNAGTPIAGVTTDFDGTPRSATAPFIGADELSVVLTPYQQWAQINGVSNNPAAIGTNGLPNLLNFAFNVNPATSAARVLSYNGNVITPGCITTQITGGTPTAQFIRRKDFASTGLTYTAQFSADLITWETSALPPTVLADDGTSQVVGLSYPLMTGGAQAQFFRVGVSIP